MTDLNKKELLALAKDAGVVGRHDMTRDELYAALDLGAEAVEAVEAVDFLGNYVYTGPFRGRPYSYVRTNDEAYAKLAPQAKAIFDFMRDTKMVARGDQVVIAAVAAGVLKTTQNPAILFAFYARKLEVAGIKLSVA